MLDLGLLHIVPRPLTTDIDIYQFGVMMYSHRAEPSPRQQGMAPEQWETVGLGRILVQL